MNDACDEPGDLIITRRQLQVSDLKQLSEKKWGCKYVDGSGACMEGLLASQITRALGDGSLKLRDGDVIKLTDYACNQINGSHKLIVTAMSVVSSEGGEADTEANGMKVDQEAVAVKEEAGASPMKVDQQPAEVKGEAKENVPVSNSASMASPDG